MCTLADSSDFLIKLAVKGGLVLVVGAVCFIWVFWKSHRLISALRRAVDSEDTAALATLMKKHRKTLWIKTVVSLWMCLITCWCAMLYLA